MKIGIYYTSGKNSGGVYQYAITMMDSLLALPQHRYVIFAESEDIPEHILKSRRVKVIRMYSKNPNFSPKTSNDISYFITYLTFKLVNNTILKLIYQIVQNRKIRIIEKENLDLIFYPTSANLSFLAKTPAVVAIHDLMHRVHPEFPEVSKGGRWQSREFIFRNIVKNSFRVLVDSKVGKKDVEKYYNANKGKVVVLPFLPPNYLQSNMKNKLARKICDSLHLPKDFVFYPSKFWPHKNHKNLLKAIKILKDRGKIVNLVLSGSNAADFSVFDEIILLVKKYKIEKHFFYVGYLNEVQISAVYKKAAAMVMPTYFGPTNIPVLEAWKMGTPVIYSDIRGCREQLGDGGLLINPKSPKDIADKIWKIYTQPKLRRRLTTIGKRRMANWTRTGFIEVVCKVVEDFSENTYSFLERQ